MLFPLCALVFGLILLSKQRQTCGSDCLSYHTVGTLSEKKRIIQSMNQFLKRAKQTENRFQVSQLAANGSCILTGLERLRKQQSQVLRVLFTIW